MHNRSVAKIATAFAPLRWLTDPCADVSSAVRPILLAQLISSPFAIVMGAVNSLIVSVAGLLRHGGTVLACCVALEIAMLLARMLAIRRIGRIRRAGEVPRIELAVLLSALWCALQGGLAFFVMQTNDLPLMVLCTTLIMGIAGPICARNYAAPRLALLLVCLCDLPFKAGAVLSGNPWLLILLPMMVPFFLGVMQIVMTFNKTLISALNAEARNNYLAEHDPLTGLLNRQGLEAAISTLPGSEDRMIAVLGIDLDGFKQVNDSHGHVAGDVLLKEVGVRLSESVRPEDLLARIGGDEFVVVIRNMETTAVARTADRLVACVAGARFHVAGASISVGASIGYACFPDDAQTIDELRLQADNALYAAKRAGKGKGMRYMHSCAPQGACAP
jgi:diguanylate cyclase (GGDEF)-like protein